MAVEKVRGCGYRKVGGLYLIGGIMNAPCDRLPITLTVCETCGAGIKVGKGFTKINPFKLWGNHPMETVTPISGLVTVDKGDNAELRMQCHDPESCYVCYPTDGVGFIMRCGEKFYTMDSFMNEARAMGVSKRIPFIPRELKVGETPIFLVHKKAGWKYEDVPDGKNGQKRMVVPCDGIFSAFIPMRIEQLVWEKDIKGKKGQQLIKDLEKRGITPVVIPNKERGGVHDPNSKKR